MSFVCRRQTSWVSQWRSRWRARLFPRVESGPSGTLGPLSEDLRAWAEGFVRASEVRPCYRERVWGTVVLTTGCLPSSRCLHGCLPRSQRGMCGWRKSAGLPRCARWVLRLRSHQAGGNGGPLASPSLASVNSSCLVVGALPVGVWNSGEGRQWILQALNLSCGGRVGLSFAILKLYLALQTPYLFSHLNLYHLSPLCIPIPSCTFVTSTIPCRIPVHDGQCPNGMCSSAHCCTHPATFSRRRRHVAM